MKFGTLASGVGAVLVSDWSVAFVGVPLPILFAALLGASLGIAYGDPIPTRRRQIIVVLVNAILGAAIGAILRSGFQFIDKAPAAAIALLLGFFARWAIPAVVEVMPAAIGTWLGGKPYRRDS